MHRTAKAWVAGLGSTLTALVVFVYVLGNVLTDGHIDGGDVSTLVTAGVTLVATVYGVWRVPNTPSTQVTIPLVRD